MIAFIGSLLLLVTAFVATDSDARRDTLTAEQKVRLEKIQRVLVETVAMTDQSNTESGPLTDTVVRRMQVLGYTVVTDPNQPHDVVLRVKCEQHKIWEGTAASGGDADLPDSPSRVWKGPACQLLYLLDGKKMGWHKEVRTAFQDARQAATDAQVDNAGAFALGKLRERLEEYHFPILLAAEWGQEDRLLKRLDEAEVSPALKGKIIAQLGEMFAAGAVPRLLIALKDPDVTIANAAAQALGNIGQKDGISALVDVLQTGKPELQAAAAKGLGQVGALHGDFSIIPPLLQALRTDNLAVQTEVAWALGKLPDKRAYEPIYALYRTLQTSGIDGQGRDGEQVQRLKEALNWSLKQVDTFDQFN
ncbi:MAG: HEAT repeat domain-containing protein [Nitrospirales bacterium]|nr:HEAT repeat domain-containing protein [Nitrospirales bacterium]